MSLAVLEPATEQVMAEVPRAGAEEVDAAVAAAKAAFPAWRAVSPCGSSRAPSSACRSDRVRVGRPCAARGAQRRQADLGRPRRDRDGVRVLPLLRGGSRAPRRPDDPRRGRRRHDLPRADGRRRPDRALELPARHHLVEDGAGPRRREHGRLEARRADAADRDRARAHRARRRPSRGRPERRRGPGLSLRAASGRAPRRGEDRLHRLDRGRARHRPGRCGNDQARDARARGQVGERRLRRRRHRGSRPRRAGRRLRERGAGLLLALAHPGRGLGDGRLPGGDGAGRPRDAGR